MLSQMSNLNQASRSLCLMNRCQTVSVKVKRSMTIGIVQGLKFEPCLFSSSTTTSNTSAISRKDIEPSQENPIDKSLKMLLLRKTFSKPGPGLRLPANRELLVNDFFELSKRILEEQFTVDEFVASKTFKELEEQVEYIIDIMSNAQVISLLVSAIKMSMNPSSNLVKLLEHEIKFRLKLLNLNQTIKLFKLYSSVEVTSEQKQLLELLSYRIRGYIQNQEVQVDDLNKLLQLIATNQLPNSLLPLVEERLLNLLTIAADEDSIISIKTSEKKGQYQSLCNLFIRLAENKRRPTPLMKAAAIQLCKLPKDLKVESSVIISTLGSLVNLSYPNRPLITKLLAALNEVIELDKTDTTTLCYLVKSLTSLRWRDELMIEKIFKFVESDLGSVDKNLALALLQLTATVSYEYPNLEQFYEACLGGEKEEQYDKRSKKWLNYVWLLVANNIANVSHLESVLDCDYQISEEDDQLNCPKLNYTDTWKLLQLKAIACHEFNLRELKFLNLDSIQFTIQRGAGMIKLSSKVQDALNSTVENHKDYFYYDIRTPYGFNIDCELHLNNEMNPIPLDVTFDGTKMLDKVNLNHQLDRRKCALIYVPYEETLASSKGDEVVGHKMMISRILKALGYETMFLTEPIINSEKTSSDLVDKIKRIISGSTTTKLTVN